MARLLGSRAGPARSGARRGIVKTRLVRLGGKGLDAARAHLRYIQRGGVERDGSPGRLYSAGSDEADGKGFLSRCEGDRHQFRFIVSPEDGAEYEDLKPLVRRWMARLEADLGTRLEWVAVDHRDTGHPHTHVMLRGTDEHGGNLVIARDYIARGMRARLAELVTLDLGPRSVLEIARTLRLEVEAERLTSIDRELVRGGRADGVVTPGHPSGFRQALRAGRLRKLETLGLAEELGRGEWKLAGRLEERLRAMGERGDIVRTMQRALRERGIERPSADRVIHGQRPLDRPLVGRVVERGLSDELLDRHYLIVDGVDGRVHHVDIGAGDSVEPLAPGSIVRVAPSPRAARPADRRVAEIAAASGGRYSMDLHLRHDPSASEEFARAHVRRLEAIRRGGGTLDRLADGSWAIAPGHVERAAAFEERAARRRPVRVDLLSPVPIERLAAAEGATWLDRELVSAEPQPLRDAGFGRDVRDALAARRRWLAGERLAREGPGGAVYPPDMLATLRRRELQRVAAVMARELGLDYVATGPGDRFAGRLERRADLASGRFAVLAGSREFTLVPWRPSLERRVGRDIEARIGSGGIGWTAARARSGPDIG